MDHEFKLVIERDGNKLYINPDIDMTKIRDSMQLDSGTVIAEMEMPDAFVSLEVQGDVRVRFSPEAIPSGFDELYTRPSSFPEELMCLIAGEEQAHSKDTENWMNDERVHVFANNWFELFIGKDRGDPCPEAYVVNAEKSTIEDLYSLMTYY